MHTSPENPNRIPDTNLEKLIKEKQLLSLSRMTGHELEQIKKNIPETISYTDYVNYLTDNLWIYMVQGIYPKISTDGIDQIIQDRSFKKNYETPTALMQDIADYIKNNMSYNSIQLIQDYRQYCHQTNQTNQYSIMISKALNQWKNEISDIQFEAFQQAVWLILQDDTQQGYQRIKNQNLNQISDKKTYQEHLIKNPQIIMQLGIYLQSINNDQIKDIILQLNFLQDDQSVSNYIKDIKVWSCRHFALLGKMLFESLKWRIIWLKTSYCWLVYNQEINHSYNQIITEDQDGKIHTQYIDITKYIANQELFIETSKSKYYGNKLNEYFVSSQEKDNNHKSLS